MATFLHRVVSPGRVLRLLGLTLLFVILTFELSVAQSNLSTLSTDKDYRLTEQVVLTNKRGGRLELGINWKRTNPLVFSKANKDEYLIFLDDILSQWGTYASRNAASGRNTIRLGYFPTHRGEISAFFFNNLADGKKFPDNQPRLRLIYCKDKDRDCIRGQVHFYSREQVKNLRAILFEAF